MENHRGRLYSVLLIVIIISSIVWYFYKLDSNISNYRTFIILFLSIICLFFYLQGLFKIHNLEFYGIKLNQEIRNSNIYETSHNDKSDKSFFIEYEVVDDVFSNQYFTESIHVQNFEKTSNNFGKKKEEDKFDEKLKIKLIKIVEDLKITTKKDFVILLLFVNENEYPLKKDTWLVENFNLIFNNDIKAQYVNQIRKTEFEIFHKNGEFTRVQKKSYELYERIKSHFIAISELKL